MSNKVYVDVLAEFSKDGLLIPKEITWEDGRKYEITRVKDKRKAASTRAGGVGERYTCVVDGKEIFLFYEETICGLWKEPEPDVIVCLQHNSYQLALDQQSRGMCRHSSELSAKGLQR